MSSPFELSMCRTPHCTRYVITAGGLCCHDCAASKLAGRPVLEHDYLCYLRQMVRVIRRAGISSP